MNCPVCLESNLTEHAEFGLSHCGTCNHMFQTDLTVTAAYDKSYIGDRYDVYPTTEAMSHLRTGLLLGLIHGQPKELLDVGYGNGAFLKIAEKAGYITHGADIHGLDYGINEVELNHSVVWQAVTFFDSLEHFPDLDVAMQPVTHALTTLVSLPNRPPDLLEDPKAWRHYKPGEHLHYFTLDSLAALFARYDRKLEWHGYPEDTIRVGATDHPNILTAAFVL